MEEENKHIDELIANYLTEGLDKNALDELKTWIAASAENQQYFIRQREIWFSAVSREAASVYDKDKAFENFRNRVESQKEIQSTSRRGFSLSALWRYAAVVAIIIAVGCISYWQGEVNVKDTFADISVEAPLGSKTKLYLPDGTLVWLNAGSRMTYSQGFGVDNRKVELEGEGYFEVKRNEKIPFFVKTKDLQLQVLGTKFNFRDYPEDHEVVVSLLEGKVGLNNLLREEKEAVLSPDERAVLNKANGLLTVESVTANQFDPYTNLTAAVTLTLTKSGETGQVTVSGAEYAPMFMLHASDSNEGRYRLLDIRKSMQDFEQGDTSVVNRSVYDRMKQGRSDLHRIFGTDEVLSLAA